MAATPTVRSSKTTPPSKPGKERSPPSLPVRTTGHVPIWTRARRAPRRGPVTSVSAHATTTAAVRSSGGSLPSWRSSRAESSSTEMWALGAEGEESIGVLQLGAVGERGVVLHDRRVPHSRANLDHLAIVPSGVWVIDSKHYRGRLQRRKVRGPVRATASAPAGVGHLFLTARIGNVLRAPRDPTRSAASRSQRRCASRVSSSASSLGPSARRRPRHLAEGLGQDARPAGTAGPRGPP